ncbi:MAG: hypothetical protein H7Y32_12035, partial [Chloroflexales bacterium]|nr:hypothetical protein [Chloroflexales bacterium]
MSGFDERAANEQQLLQWRKNLARLELQIASAGGEGAASLEKLNQRDEALEQVAALEQALAALPLPPPAPAPVSALPQAPPPSGLPEPPPDSAYGS